MCNKNEVLEEKANVLIHNDDDGISSEVIKRKTINKKAMEETRKLLQEKKAEIERLIDQIDMQLEE